MALTRRAALKGVLATASAVPARASTASAYERHQIGVTEAAVPFGLPPRSTAFASRFLTDIHHSALVPADDVAYGGRRLPTTQKPDLVVLGGDYVTFGDRAYVEPVAELLAPLEARYGVFAILGNHDDDRDMPAALDARHITVLKDQHTRIEVRGEGLELAGIRFWTRRAGEDCQRAARNARDTVLLLAHDPRRLVEAPQLDIAGGAVGPHARRQIVIPGVGAGRRAQVPGDSPGLGSRENTSIFVSRGVGTVYVPSESTVRRKSRS